MFAFSPPAGADIINAPPPSPSQSRTDCLVSAAQVHIVAPEIPFTMEKVHLLSLGCPKNLADSELMIGALVNAGFEVTLDPDEAQVLV